MRRAARFAVLAVLAAGCASAPPPRSSSGTEPWGLPVAEVGQQSLFRVNYQGPGGGGSLRLVLRLESEATYLLTASDPFGRALWSLVSENQRGHWIDFRAQRWCPVGDRVGLRELGLPAMPLRAVPLLLVGRVPLPPGGREAQTLDYRDAHGRRWTVSERAGEVVTWTLWEDAEPSLWFRQQQGESVLSSRKQGAQLRWRRTLREPLEGPLAIDAVPAGFEEGGCDEPRLP